MISIYLYIYCCIYIYICIYTHIIYVIMYMCIIFYIRSITCAWFLWMIILHDCMYRNSRLTVWISMFLRAVSKKFQPLKSCECLGRYPQISFHTMQQFFVPRGSCLPSASVGMHRNSLLVAGLEFECEPCVHSGGSPAAAPSDENKSFRQVWHQWWQMLY